MKKTIILLLIVAALGVMSCEHDPKPEKKLKSDVDMAIIDHGQLQFYNHATQKLTPYEAETDSVVNILFDKSDHLYYTAAHQQALMLKSLDLTESHPQPKVCANWKLTLGQITDMMFNTGASSIFMDENMENIYMISSYFDEENPIGVEVYNIASGSTKGLTYEEFQPVNTLTVAQDHFYDEQGMFYYVTPEGKVCLNNQIDFSKVFEEGDLADLYFYPNRISADGKQIVYESDIEIGEGWGYYCVASSDGQHQSVLTDTDTWTITPDWLTDGSLVYVGEEPRPESDPDYDADWNTTRHCIKIVDPQGVASLLVSDAEDFYINPVEPLKPREKQASLIGCDMAICDNGKLTFYNSTNNTFVPMINEKDYVVSGSFFDEDILYYTVAIGDELYLKEIYMASVLPEPVLLTDWDLKLSDCYSEKCGKTARMESYLDLPLTRIECGVYEDVCVFTGVEYYNRITEEKTDFWPEEYDYSIDIVEEEQLRKDLNLLNLDRFDLNLGGNVEENALELYSISPSHDCFAYAYYTELGPTGGSGPLCFATLDGKVKMALEGTNVLDVYYGWLSDGRLAYSDNEGIKAVAADGTITKISDDKMFVTIH